MILWQLNISREQEVGSIRYTLYAYHDSKTEFFKVKTLIYVTAALSSSYRKSKSTGSNVNNWCAKSSGSLCAKSFSATVKSYRIPFLISAKFIFQWNCSVIYSCFIIRYHRKRSSVTTALVPFLRVIFLQSTNAKDVLARTVLLIDQTFIISLHISWLIISYQVSLLFCDSYHFALKFCM